MGLAFGFRFWARFCVLSHVRENSMR